MNVRGKGCLLPIIGLVVIVVIVGAMLAGSYNKFVSAEETVDQKWGRVNVDLQRRYDLIPNLVETVQGIAKQEKEVIKEVTDARAALGGARTPDERLRQMSSCPAHWAASWSSSRIIRH